ncbi:uncharacterized protein LOC129775938 isoform X2 [Toxorhynchites rutilus septentrionalis]|uniref:uncharacterized protein LOC129775938 isoform X2 n=1 Tax=Toxorhynchites rutilus septentrionalis TaxID=329112 RepID=UPI00247AF392|nr:uncharacterized protein LOC129775938 isoform X2 [Toxorhynchites rutilus septentrionalis]
MCAAIENPATCEVRSVIRFLLAKNYKPITIFRELREVYGNGIMSESRVRQWCIDFSKGRTNVHYDGRSGRPSLVTENLMKEVDKKIRGNRRFTITELSEHFPQISRSLVHKIVVEKLGYHDFFVSNTKNSRSEDQSVNDIHTSNDSCGKVFRLESSYNRHMAAAHKKKYSKYRTHAKQQHYNDRAGKPSTGICTISTAVKQQYQSMIEVKTEISDELEQSCMDEDAVSEMNEVSGPIEDVMPSLEESGLQSNDENLDFPEWNQHRLSIDDVSTTPAVKQENYICDHSMIDIKTEISDEPEQFGMDEIAENDMIEPSGPIDHCEYQSNDVKLEFPESNSSILECNSEKFTDGECYIKCEFE